MTWTRSAWSRVCGRCRTEIPAGAIFATLTIGHVSKVRCGHCAGGPVPPSLPAALEHAAPPPLNWQRAGLLPLDWRQRASGEREPGMEG